MASQRDPTFYGFLAVVGALEAVLGVLFLVGHLDDPLVLALGIGLTTVGVAMVVLGVCRYRREKARTD